MTSSTNPRGAALALAGVGVASTLVLSALVPGVIASVAAKTVIVVGGASDPTAVDQWNRISGDHTGPPPVLVQYPAVFGIGWPGLALSSDGRHTYAQSNDIGAAATVAAINAAKQSPDEEVVVYTISQGADVVGLAVLRYGQDHPRPVDGSANLTVIAQGSPSFIRSGAWNSIPAGIPGFHNGPVRNDGVAGATTVSVCVKGDIGCGWDPNPLITAFYFPPGFLMHGTVYTAQDIGRYSPAGGEPYTPGSVAEAPVQTRTEMRNGTAVTVETYANGTVKRTWNEDNTTWVSIDTGENPWGWVLRRNGIAAPIGFDRMLDALMPVPEPGGAARTPGQLFAPAPDRPASSARHSTDRPDAVPVADLLAAGDQQTQPVTARPEPASAAAPLTPPASTEPAPSAPQPTSAPGPTTNTPADPPQVATGSTERIPATDSAAAQTSHESQPTVAEPNASPVEPAGTAADS